MKKPLLLVLSLLLLLVPAVFAAAMQDIHDQGACS